VKSGEELEVFGLIVMLTKTWERKQEGRRRLLKYLQRRPLRSQSSVYFDFSFMNPLGREKKKLSNNPHHSPHPGSQCLKAQKVFGEKRKRKAMRWEDASSV